MPEPPSPRREDLPLTLRRLEDLLKRTHHAPSTPELLPAYLSELSRRQSIGLMPPSPLIKRVRVTGTFNVLDSTIAWAARHEWRPEARAVWDELPADRKFHRSRVVTIGSNANSIPEIFKRLHKQAKLRPILEKAPRLNPKQQEQVGDIFASEVSAHYGFKTQAHCDKYIAEHSHAAIGPNVRWEWLRGVRINELAEIERLHRELLIDPMVAGKLRGMYQQSTWSTGNRSRNYEIPANYSPGMEVRGLALSSRNVFFEALKSTPAWGIEDKNSMYSKMFTRLTTEVLDFPWKWWTPLVHGARVYAEFARLHDDYARVVMLDGPNWDSSVAYILGEPMAPLYTTFGGGKHLASGSFGTSPAGTSANFVEAELLLDYLGGDSEIGIIGDDLFVATNSTRDIAASHTVLEVDEDDTALGFSEGLRWLRDERVMALQGAKLTRDNAAALQSVPVYGDGNFDSGWIPGHHDEATVERHVKLLLTSRLDGMPLLDVFAKADPKWWRDDQSPSTQLVNMVSGSAVG
jgi:hypothetical protein